MAVREIVLHTDNFIRKKSKPVKVFDEKLWDLLDDMWETLEVVPGSGLSAVQVGVLKRLFIIIDEKGEMVEFINPEILEASGENPILEEGCLSVPGKYGKVMRPNKVKIRAYNKKGEKFDREFVGFFAKAICHESDHLDGILYIDKQIKKEKKNKQEKNN